MLVVEEDCTSLLHGMNGGGSVEEDDGDGDETDMLDSDGVVVVGAIVVVVVVVVVVVGVVAVVFIDVVLSIDDVGRVNGGVLVVAGGNGTMVGTVMGIHGNVDVMTPLEGADGNVVGNT